MIKVEKNNFIYKIKFILLIQLMNCIYTYISNLRAIVEQEFLTSINEQPHNVHFNIIASVHVLYFIPGMGAGGVQQTNH